MKIKFFSLKQKRLVQKKNSSGFTLVEMLVTLSIIVIMSSILVLYTHSGGSIMQANRAIERLSFDIRRVANLSMQTKQIKERAVCGWGLYFDAQNPNAYIVFSDFCEDNNYGDHRFEDQEKQEIITLAKPIEILATNLKCLIYEPPEPTLYLYDVSNIQIKKGEITLGVKGTNNQRILEINEAGNITIK